MGGGVEFGPGFVLLLFVFFLVSYQLAEEERAGCFTLIASVCFSMCLCLCSGVYSNWYCIGISVESDL